MTTDNTIDLEDAIRALRDRPSMEAELTALRDENLRLVERNRELVANLEAEGGAHVMCAIKAARHFEGENKRLKAALRGVQAWLEKHSCQIYSHIEVRCAQDIARNALNEGGGDE